MLTINSNGEWFKQCTLFICSLHPITQYHLNPYVTISSCQHNNNHAVGRVSARPTNSAMHVIMFKRRNRCECIVCGVPCVGVFVSFSKFPLFLSHYLLHHHSSVFFLSVSSVYSSLFTEMLWRGGKKTKQNLKSNEYNTQRRLRKVGLFWQKPVADISFNYTYKANKGCAHNQKCSHVVGVVSKEVPVQVWVQCS